MSSSDKNTSRQADLQNAAEEAQESYNTPNQPGAATKKSRQRIPATSHEVCHYGFFACRKHVVEQKEAPVYASTHKYVVLDVENNYQPLSKELPDEVVSTVTLHATPSLQIQKSFEKRWRRYGLEFEFADNHKCKVTGCAKEAVLAAIEELKRSVVHDSQPTSELTCSFLYVVDQEQDLSAYKHVGGYKAFRSKKKTDGHAVIQTQTPVIDVNKKQGIITPTNIAVDAQLAVFRLLVAGHRYIPHNHNAQLELQLGRVAFRENEQKLTNLTFNDLNKIKVGKNADIVRKFFSGLDPYQTMPNIANVLRNYEKKEDFASLVFMVQDTRDMSMYKVESTTRKLTVQEARAPLFVVDKMSVLPFSTDKVVSFSTWDPQHVRYLEIRNYIKNQLVIEDHALGMFAFKGHSSTFTVTSALQCNVFEFSPSGDSKVTIKYVDELDMFTGFQNHVVSLTSESLSELLKSDSLGDKELRKLVDCVSELYEEADAVLAKK
jgi:hypothetical protein